MRATLSRKFRNLAGVSAVALIALAAPAGATVIDSATNNPLNFSWSYTTPGGAVLDGTGSLTVSGFSSNSLTVAITLDNDAALANERLTSFGFGINPDATSVSFSDAADDGMINASLDSIPSLATIEVCAYGGPNCSGGGNGGIFGGGSDSFSLILAGTWGTSVDIAPIGFKYQTDAGSFEFTSNDPGPGPNPIPEPMALSLFGLGVAGLGLVSRRRRRQA